MKRLIAAWGIALLIVPSSACSPPFAIFEDVGTDPHPPQVQLVGVALQPETSEDDTAPEVDLQPGEGFVVHPLKAGEDALLFRVRYSDAGGDIQSFTVRDRDSAVIVDISPTAPDVDLDGDGEPDPVEFSGFFTGTSGIFDIQDVKITATKFGPHRMEIWAVDSHDSRSEKITFTIQVEP